MALDYWRPPESGGVHSELGGRWVGVENQLLGVSGAFAPVVLACAIANVVVMCPGVMMAARPRPRPRRGFHRPRPRPPPRPAPRRVDEWPRLLRYARPRWSQSAREVYPFSSQVQYPGLRGITACRLMVVVPGAR